MCTQKGKRNNLWGKNELMWLHTYGKKRYCMENRGAFWFFGKGREIEESKVGFSGADGEFWEADANIRKKRKNRRGGEILGGDRLEESHRRERLGTGTEGEDWWTGKVLSSRFLSQEKVQQPGTKQLERRTRRYVSRLLLYHHLVSIFLDFLVFLKIHSCRLVWTQGPQFE